MVSVEEIAWHLEPFNPEPADDDPLVAAILDGIAYRLVMRHALAVIHDLHGQHERLREKHQRLEDAYRALCEQTIEAAQ